MIILRQKQYNEDTLSLTFLGGTAGAAGGAFLGDKIDDAIRYRKAKKSINIEEEKEKIKKEIQNNKDFIKELGHPEMKKMQEENYEFEDDPETWKEINRGLKEELKLADKDPKEFIHRRTKASTGQSLTGAGIGASIGGMLGSVGGYKLAKRLAKK